MKRCIDRIRSHLLQIVLLSILTIIVVMPMISAYEGDQYITYIFARNFVNGHFFEFNVGQTSLGSTSPLWIILLAPCFLLSDPIGATKVIALGLSIAVTITAYSIVWHLTQNNMVSFLGSLIVVIDPTKAYTVAIAMDTTLFTFLSLLALLILVRSSISDAKLTSILFLGFILGAAILARPEGIFLFIIVFGKILLSKNKEIRELMLNLVGLILSALAVAGPYFLWAWMNVGTPFPSSFGGRFLTTVSRAPELFGVSYSITGLFTLASIYSVLGIVFLIHTLIKRNEVFDVALLWTVALIGFYAVVFPNANLRYVAPIFPVTACFGIVAIIRSNFLEKLSSSIRLPKQPGLVVLLLLLLSPVYIQSARGLLTRYDMVDYIYDVDFPARHGVCDWADENLNSSNVVAAIEIDMIKYYSDIYLLDLNGIIEPAALEYRNENRMLAYLLDFNATHILVEGNIYAEVPIWSASDLAPLAGSHEVGNHVLLNNVLFEVVYRVTAYENYYWFVYSISFQ